MAFPKNVSLSWHGVQATSELDIYTYVHTAKGYRESYSLLFRIRLSEQNLTVTPLRVTLSRVSLLSTEQVRSLLLCYADEKIAKLVSEKVDIRKLVALLLHIEEKYGHYGRPLLDVVIDEESGEFQFVSVVLPNCDWGSWRRIARGLKEELRKTGLSDLASKVAIVCLQGLQELTR